MTEKGKKFREELRDASRPSYNTTNDRFSAVAAEDRESRAAYAEALKNKQKIEEFIKTGYVDSNDMAGAVHGRIHAAEMARQADRELKEAQKRIEESKEFARE